MSAYVVNDETINKVVSFLYLKAQSNGLSNWGVSHVPYSIREEIGQRTLASSMFCLNVEAVNQRYGENQAQEFRPLDFQYRFTVNTNRFTALKALECWLYQCSEGNIPETSLYQAMQKVANGIRRGIINDLPEYKTVDWG